MKNLFVVFLCSMGWFSSFGQVVEAGEVIKKYSFKEDIASISVDRYGNVFVAEALGGIYKFSAKGDSLEMFSPNNNADISLLEAWGTIWVFAFYADIQGYRFLNRFANATEIQLFDESKVGLVKMAAPSQDGNIWIFDEIAYAVKKYDQRVNELIFETPVDLSLFDQEVDVVQMRELNNLLLVVDRLNGVHVFDALGNYQRTIDYPVEFPIGTMENYLIAPSADSTITYLDIYSSETFIFPFIEGASQIIGVKSGELAFFKGKELFFFRTGNYPER